MLKNHYKKVRSIINSNLKKILKLRKYFLLKSDNSPVSKSDLFIQKLLIDYFSKEYPSLLILSEENYKFGNFHSQNLVLIIDPIDGTENFVSGLPIWGVALSFWQDSHHVSSMIYLPELKKAIISGDKINYNQSRITGFSSSINNELLSLIQPDKESRIFGCSVFNFYNVITKSFNSFENPKGAYVWDLIAGLNLALEHGCIVTVEGKKYHGEFLNPNKRHRFKVSNE